MLLATYVRVGFVNNYGAKYFRARESKMVALLQKLVVGYWTDWRQSSPATTQPPNKEPMIGKYRADYSQLTPEQIAQEDKELTELYANSRPVSR